MMIPKLDVPASLQSVRIDRERVSMIHTLVLSDAYAAELIDRSRHRDTLPDRHVGERREERGIGVVTVRDRQRPPAGQRRPADAHTRAAVQRDRGAHRPRAKIQQRSKQERFPERLPATTP